MHAFSSEHRRSLLSGHSVVRLLIVSYFVALALGVIDGTDLSALAAPFLPLAFAKIVVALVVLSLCAMILIGWHRRAAALVLALAMFWASYMAMMNAPDQNLGAFWRDLALIGALVMTYADTKQKLPDTESSTEAGGRPISRISQAISTTRSVISRPSARAVSKGSSEKTELYRKDLDIVRAS